MSDRCDEEVFRHGVSLLAIDGRANDVEPWVQKVAARSGQKVDWHYTGGVAHVLVLGDHAKAMQASEVPRRRGALEASRSHDGASHHAPLCGRRSWALSRWRSGAGWRDRGRHLERHERVHRREEAMTRASYHMLDLDALEARASRLGEEAVRLPLLALIARVREVESELAKAKSAASLMAKVADRLAGHQKTQDDLLRRFIDRVKSVADIPCVRSWGSQPMKCFPHDPCSFCRCRKLMEETSR
jgi:hypothetical protein